jgi:M6 family metalloprotease-like protein
LPASRFATVYAIAIAALLAQAIPSGATMPPAQGSLPPEVAAAMQEGLTRLPAPPSGLPTSAVVLPSVWHIPVILVNFADSVMTYSPAGFDSMLFDTTGSTTGSVSEYYRWASGGRLKVVGRVIAVVQLPHERSYYAYNSFGISRTSTPHNSAGLTLDALVACSANVNWAEFDSDRDGFVDMLWVIHQGMPGEGSNNRFDNFLWSITSRLDGYWSSCSAYETEQVIPGTTQHYRVDRFSMLPELSYFKRGNRAEIGVYCHEFGHALGLPDLYNTMDGGARNAGPGSWSLMATGGYGGNGHSPEYPTHLGAWPSVFLGWANLLRPSGDTPMVLPPLGGSTPQILDLCFQGEVSTDHYLVEARSRSGFDRNLPNDGLIIYHADEATIGQGLQSNTVNAQLFPGLVVTEADSHSDLTTGMNRGDAGDPFPGSAMHGNFYDEGLGPNTFTFDGAPMGTGLFDIRVEPEGISFLAQVRARGWQSPVDCTVGAYTPADQNTPGEVAVRASDGTIYAVASETRSGHLQVVLRTRQSGLWDEGVQVSSSSGDAFEPAIARLGADGVAVAWSDTRSGGTRLYYRALVRGTWGAEQLLYGASGESRGVALSADERGRVHAAWIHVAAAPEVLYKRFSYLSPAGQVYTMSGSGSVPSSACVAAVPTGGVVAWIEGRSWPSSVWYARCDQDSMPDPPGRLTEQTGAPQTCLSILADSLGQIHTLWLQSNSTTSELHYLCRMDLAGYVQEDTTLEISSGTLSHARLARDPQGGLHAVFERSVSGVTMIRYRRRRPDLRWDAFSTDVTSVADGAAVKPTALPSAPGEVTVLYRGYQAGSSRFMSRARTTDQPPPTAVDEPPAPLALAPRGLVYPNPARVGAAIETRWSGALAPAAGSGWLDVFDLMGRRVSSVALQSDGTWLRGRLAPDDTRRWAPGIYLVRPRRAGAPAQRLVVLR